MTERNKLTFNNQNAFPFELLWRSRTFPCSAFLWHGFTNRSVNVDWHAQRLSGFIWQLCHSTSFFFFFCRCSRTSDSLKTRTRVRARELILMLSVAKEQKKKKKIKEVKLAPEVTAVSYNVSAFPCVPKPEATESVGQRPSTTSAGCHHNHQRCTTQGRAAVPSLFLTTDRWTLDKLTADRGVGVGGDVDCL